MAQKQDRRKEKEGSKMGKRLQKLQDTDSPESRAENQKSEVRSSEMRSQHGGKSKIGGESPVVRLWPSNDSDDDTA